MSNVVVGSIGKRFPENPFFFVIGALPYPANLMTTAVATTTPSLFLKPEECSQYER